LTIICKVHKKRDVWARVARLASKCGSISEERRSRDRKKRYISVNTEMGLDTKIHRFKSWVTKIARILTFKAC